MMNVYNPYRVKSPMKRTNPRKGLEEDPGWVEITLGRSAGYGRCEDAGDCRTR